MKRLQIMIEEDLDAALERRALDERTSKAALIRRFVREAIELLPPLHEEQRVSQSSVPSRPSFPAPDQGLARECVVNCDNLFTIPKSALGARRGGLVPESLDRLPNALRIELDLD